MDWIDPLVGFSICQGLALDQEVLLRAEVAGFDVSSKFSLNAPAAYGFDLPFAMASPLFLLLSRNLSKGSKVLFL